MRRLSFGGLLPRLLLLVVLAVLPALVLIVYTSIESRADAIDRAQGEALSRETDLSQS